MKCECQWGPGARQSNLARAAECVLAVLQAMAARGMAGPLRVSWVDAACQPLG